MPNPDMWQATEAAMTVIEAHDDPDVVALYVEACDALAKYAQAMTEHGVPRTQVFGQLQGAPNAVLFRSLGWDQ